MKTFAKRRLEQLAASAGIPIDESTSVSLRVKNEAFYQRVTIGGSLALGESYMEGWWDCDDLHALFCRLLVSVDGRTTTASIGRRLRDLQGRIFNRQSLSRARQVVDKHYEVPLDVFTAMLDRRMVYSCAYWRDATSLDEAQEHKLDLICRKLQLTEGDVLLDVGCGFGGLLRYAVERYGCRGIGITNSSKQAEFARGVCAGLPIGIWVADYRRLDAVVGARIREVTKVASVGMFEHVGPKNYRQFAEIVLRRVPPGGLVLLQTIGDNRTHYRCEPWLEKYIFPNGVAPSPRQIAGSIEGLCVIEDWHNFGPDYATTLLCWAQRFATSYQAGTDVCGMPSDRFRRMWLYYLNSFASAFTVRQLQLWQIVWSKGRRPGTYTSVR